MPRSLEGVIEHVEESTDAFERYGAALNAVVEDGSRVDR
jgi:hypothetical protein